MLAQILNTMPIMTVPKEKGRPDQRTIGFSVLYEATKILEEPHALPQRLTAILKIVSAFMGITRGSVCLYDPTRREISIEAAFGLTDEERRRARYRIGEGIPGKVLKLGIPIALPDISKEPNFLNKTHAREARDLQGIASICLPIKIGGKVLGVLSVERPSYDTQASLEEDLRVLTIMASLIGYAVKLHQEVTRNIHSLDDWKGLREIERELVMRALKESGGIQVKAAARLGITPRQLAYKIQKNRIIKEFRIKS